MMMTPPTTPMAIPTLAPVDRPPSLQHPQHSPSADSTAGRTGVSERSLAVSSAPKLHFFQPSGPFTAELGTSAFDCCSPYCIWAMAMVSGHSGSESVWSPGVGGAGAASIVTAVVTVAGVLAVAGVDVRRQLRISEGTRFSAEASQAKSN